MAIALKGEATHAAASLRRPPPPPPSAAALIGVPPTFTRPVRPSLKLSGGIPQS